MYCCTQCFESSYLNGVIYNNKEIGDCDYCQSRSVPVYKASELSIFFKAIIDLYEVDQKEGKPIEKQINSDFPGKVFTMKVVKSDRVRQLISDVISDDLLEYRKVLDNPVSLKYRKMDVEEVIIQPLSLTWDRFSQEIKSVNRFHFVNNLNLEKLKYLFKSYAKEIPKGKKFYRARVSEHAKGFKESEMWNPPENRAKGGRANPTGISYLYIADTVHTGLYEVRASLYDYVCVATFRLQESINVVNLSKDTYDVFRLAELESLEEVLIHESFIGKLEQELSRPRRKSDSELDYLPTQYLSELIKSIGFDGIEFQSSLYDKGFNIAVFEPGKFELIKIENYEIKDINLEYGLAKGDK